MHVLTRMIVVVCAAGVIAIGPSAWGDQVVDDFESYADGQIVGLTATSTPWRRFGGATNDNVTATGHDRWNMTGTRSALYGVVWPAPFGAVRRIYDEANDLSEFNSATVKMRSDRTGTHTHAMLAVSNGLTTFVSITEHALTGQKQDFAFQMDRASMVRTNGSDSFEAVIGGVRSIGFDFRNIEGEYTETIVFDDFVLTNSDAAENATASKQ